MHQFTDEEVLGPDFGQTVMEAVKAAKPLVYWCAIVFFSCSMTLIRQH
jgi:hypothetical protein